MDRNPLFTKKQMRSLLGNNRPHSLSPLKPRQAARPVSFDASKQAKYKYLSEINFLNHNTLKQIAMRDQRYAKNRQVSSQSVPDSKLKGLINYGIGLDSKSKITDNSTNKPMESSSDNQIKFLKTSIRNSSFDPILGYFKRYPTPIKSFRVFGSNRGDLYRINGFFRRNQSKFVSGLRSYR